MKKLLTLLSAVCFTVLCFAQSPQKMSFQAVIRNGSNQLVTSQTVGMRISILQTTSTGTAVYVETQTPTTNVNGLISIEIGSGTVVSGTFAAINWAAGPYYIKTETDPTGGSSYSITGVSQILSVPYALMAKNAENAWTMTGNAGTTAGTNFIGTTDANDLIFKTNNTERLKLTSTGKVGIGMAGRGCTYPLEITVPSTPGSQMNLKLTNLTLGTGSGVGILFAPDDAAIAKMGIFVERRSPWGLSTMHFLSRTSQDYASADLSNSVMSITSNGYLGIGTTSPAAKLDVAGAVKIADGTQGLNKVLTSDANGLASWQAAQSQSQSLNISHDTISMTNGSRVRLPNTVSNVRILNDSLYINYTYGQVSNAGFIGNGKAGTSVPAVTTSGTTDLSYTSASVSAVITNSGNELILSKGVCLSGLSSPDLNDTVYFSGSGSGSFVAACTPLALNTTYHVRAFATNSVGTSYGNELTFSTKALSVPVLSTQATANITNTTAISGGNITDDGGSPVLARGICWALTANPTISGNHVAEGLGTGSYIALMTGLTSGTTYHARAYATNAQGTSYGADVSFTTITYQLATITTTAAGSVSYTTATSGGNVSSDNGSAVTGRGICWATTASPTTANSNYTEAGGLGTFTANITGLTANTTYYVRAFAINGGGTSYGNQITFTTLPPSVATLTTKAISGISSNVAGSGGTISADGGSAITAKGVCWSVNSAPTTTNNKTTDGTGITSYNSTMSGLNALTTYYVRAYATNSSGTAYGNEISFTTTDLALAGPTVPVVGTSVSTIATNSTATSGGYVSSDGGSTVTMRGVCWSTSQNPTLANSFSTDGGSGLGYFNSTVTSLSGCGTVYYIRAYATNSTGTGYGNQNTISTGLYATITTDDATGITYNSATSGGSATSDGGCSITQKGVCWSHTPTPTISNAHTSEGAGNGSFVSAITGLNPNWIYYVRAYATNSVGTTYGPQKTFTTTLPTSGLYVGMSYGGGIIFYLDATGEHGLICAAADQGSYAWGCAGTSIATGTAVGTGPANTAAIVAGCSDANTAAKICDNLILNGYSDWYLPSIDELALISANLYSYGLISFSGNYFWSSSQYSATNGYFFYFNNQSASWGNKSTGWSVRAIRAF